MSSTERLATFDGRRVSQFQAPKPRTVWQEVSFWMRMPTAQIDVIEASEISVDTMRNRKIERDRKVRREAGIVEARGTTAHA
jgi:hypothetical protein